MVEERFSTEEIKPLITSMEVVSGVPSHGPGGLKRKV
jgi:hypothetical protein